MTETPLARPLQVVAAPSLGRRLWNGVLAVWGALTGVAPHVLHHVGPLAGAAILAGAGGRLLFFAIGLVAAVPLLLRLYRRFRTWAAPATAVAAFAAMFALSSFVVAPLITGSDGSGAQQMPASHASHHGGSDQGSP